MLIKKILYPIDLSEDAKTGMAYAVSLAREHNAELVFFHVTRFPSWELAYPCEPNPFFQRHVPLKFSVDNLFRTAAGRVQNLVQANFGTEVIGLTWKVTVSLGNIPREIVAGAVEDKGDLIIMAKRKTTYSSSSLYLQYFGSSQRIRFFPYTHRKSCSALRRGAARR